MNKIRERAGSAALFMAIGITGFAVAMAVATAVAQGDDSAEFGKDIGFRLVKEYSIRI